uniref:Uncharacterized protein n=1 Tax=Avena sativa TaxID=4498 RepID=A0ACD5U8Q6_AVESA
MVRRSLSPTSSLPQGPIPCALLTPKSQLADMVVCDCRHGRVLLDDGEVTMKLVVWDPMTGLRRELSDPHESLFYIGTTVLCAVDGCYHSTCHEGPFHAVFIGIDAEVGMATTYKYSSESGEWSTPMYELSLVGELDIVVELDLFNKLGPVDDGYALQTVLVEDTLHFLLMSGPQGNRILKYDLGRHFLSLIIPPAVVAVYERGSILMATEDGRLGIAQLDNLFVHLWSGEAGPDGVEAWAKHRAIDLMPFCNHWRSHDQS